MEKINENRREELEAALQILKGDNGRIDVLFAIRNPMANGYNEVLEALDSIGIEEPEYLDYFMWYDMNEEDRAEYGAENFREFCDVCDSFNRSLINKAIRAIEAELGK